MEEGNRVLNQNMLRMVLSIVLAIVLTVSWWLSRSESDKASDIPKNEQTIDNKMDGLQALVEEKSVDEVDGLSSVVLPPMDENVVEFKYRNLKRLMSTRIDTLDEYQLEMVAQQIISQLPEMVNMGLMHPFDATFAHTQIMSKQSHRLQAFNVETIKQNYMDLYPFPINSSQLDLH